MNWAMTGRSVRIALAIICSPFLFRSSYGTIKITLGTYQSKLWFEYLDPYLSNKPNSYFLMNVFADLTSALIGGILTAVLVKLILRIDFKRIVWIPALISLFLDKRFRYSVTHPAEDGSVVFLVTALMAPLLLIVGAVIIETLNEKRLTRRCS